MSAAELRKAAETLRGLASKATPGPWRCTEGWGAMKAHGVAFVQAGDEHSYVVSGGAPSLDEDTPYVATMHPGVGLALADWLSHSARFAQLREDNGAPSSESADPRPLRVARLINGGVA